MHTRTSGGSECGSQETGGGWGGAKVAFHVPGDTQGAIRNTSCLCCFLSLNSRDHTGRG